MNDAYLDGRLAKLKNKIEKWARKHDLWHDCGFTSYLEHFDALSEHIVLLMWYEGPLYDVLNYHSRTHLAEEFSELCMGEGFFAEPYDHTTMTFSILENGELKEAFGSYLRWKWICSLLVPDTGDVFEELYKYFSNDPDRLKDLDWREFEILLFRIFQNHGFEAELGPGSGDGGVDIRLLLRDPIGDLMTLVQAKKYAQHRKVGLEAVQALHGAAAVENAESTIFATTSEYLPSARSFVARTSGSMTLWTSADVAEWCRHSVDGIIQDKSKLISRTSVQSALRNSASENYRNVYHANSGYNITVNNFAIVLKETSYAALLMGIGKRSVSGDKQEGTEVPHIDEDTIFNHTEKKVFRAKKHTRRNEILFWDGERLFTKWSGKPEYFTWLD